MTVRDEIVREIFRYDTRLGEAADATLAVVARHVGAMPTITQRGSAGWVRKRDVLALLRGDES